MTAMRITLCVERAEPLAGHASKESEEPADDREKPMAFEGWLGLLRVLSEIVGTETRENRWDPARRPTW